MAAIPPYIVYEEALYSGTSGSTECASYFYNSTHPTWTSTSSSGGRVIDLSTDSEDYPCTATTEVYPTSQEVSKEIAKAIRVQESFLSTKALQMAHSSRKVTSSPQPIFHFRRPCKRRTSKAVANWRKQR